MILTQSRKGAKQEWERLAFRIWLGMHREFTQVGHFPAPLVQRLPDPLAGASCY